MKKFFKFLLNPFYAFWNVFSFGMLKMEYRALATLLFGLYANVNTIVNYLYEPNLSKTGGYLLGIPFVVIYLSGVVYLNKRNDFQHQVYTNAYKISSVFFVLTYITLSIYLWISTN